MKSDSSLFRESTDRIRPGKPSADDATLGITSPSSAMSMHDEAPISILIVDDEPRNLTVLETVLNDAGYRLVRATSADQALLALVVEEFALLILDIRMPGMNGFELAQMIKERKKTAHIPIIFLTAHYNEDQHVLDGYETGAVDYLHKPVSPFVLRAKVAVFAQLYRKNRECEVANRGLLAEVNGRLRIEEQLREFNATLEQRVTERAEALRENESRLQQAAQAAGLTYAELDFVTGKLSTAENFAIVMGYASVPNQERDFSSTTRLLLDHVVPEDRRRVEAAFQDFGSDKADHKIDYRILGDDRNERWIESAWSVDISADGKPLKAFITNLDVTARKQGELALQLSKERFRQLADSMPQMVWTALPNGHVDYYNERWYEFTGLDPERFDQISWEAILHPDDLTPCREAWQTSLQTGNAYEIEYRLWDRRSERYCWYLGRALPVCENSLIVKWFGTCTDIDEQKRNEHNLRRANQDLEQFAFSASHDLQEPLRNIVVSSQLLMQSCGTTLGQEANEFLHYIVEGAQRMSQLVSGLLSYTHAASLDSEPSAHDAGAVLGHVLETLHGTIQESHGSITYDTLPTVFVTGVHLEQLLQNLIGNALKYRKDHEPPQIRITAARDGSMWRFSLQDNGIGIAPQHQQSVFGLFKRLHPRDSKYSGTGIGLAICKTIVERYGGRIWIESILEQGTTVWFTLPTVGRTFDV